MKDQPKSWICPKCRQEVFITPDHHAYVCRQYIYEFTDDYRESEAPLIDLVHRKRKGKK